MATEKKTLKFQMMMSPEEAEILDDWMFKNRIRSRAEAIRRLCQTALAIDEPVVFNAILATKFSEAARKCVENAKAIFDDPSTGIEQKRTDIEAHFDYITRSAQHILNQAGLIFSVNRAFRSAKDLDEVLNDSSEKIALLSKMTREGDPYDPEWSKVFADLVDLPSPSKKEPE